MGGQGVVFQRCCGPRSMRNGIASRNCRLIVDELPRACSWIIGQSTGGPVGGRRGSSSGGGSVESGRGSSSFTSSEVYRSPAVFEDELLPLLDLFAKFSEDTAVILAAVVQEKTNNSEDDITSGGAPVGSSSSSGGGPRGPRGVGVGSCSPKKKGGASFDPFRFVGQRGDGAPDGAPQLSHFGGTSLSRGAAVQPSSRGATATSVSAVSRQDPEESAPVSHQQSTGSSSRRAMMLTGSSQIFIDKMPSSKKSTTSSRGNMSVSAQSAAGAGFFPPNSKNDVPTAKSTSNPKTLDQFQSGSSSSSATTTLVSVFQCSLVELKLVVSNRLKKRSLTRDGVAMVLVSAGILPSAKKDLRLVEELIRSVKKASGQATNKQTLSWGRRESVAVGGGIVGVGGAFHRAPALLARGSGARWKAGVCRVWGWFSFLPERVFNGSGRNCSYGLRIQFVQLYSLSSPIPSIVLYNSVCE